MEYPAKTLKDAFNACETEPLPAGDPRYVDLSRSRGGEASVVARCRQKILLSEQPLAQLFAGHRGCGKSTELRRLQSELEGDGYFVVFIRAETDLDLEDVEPTDVLLTLVRQLDLALRAERIEVSSKLLQDFLNWFAEIVHIRQKHRDIEAELTSEAEVGGRVPLFAKMVARLTGQVKTGTQSKRDVRLRLDPLLSQLLERAAALTNAARKAIRERRYRDLVLIVDSLDRIALKQVGEGRTSHEVLFIERGNLLKGLGCHSILTVPISLLFSSRAPNLAAIFPDRHVLPMVKTRERGTRAISKEGRAALRNALEHRLHFETVLEEGVVDDLIDVSGGHPRQLMSVAREAVSLASRLPVTRAHVARAAQQVVDDYGRAIPQAQWALLARVYAVQQVINDADHQQMLFNLSVLEYQNAERWCDVNPVVTRLPQFQRALAALEAPDKMKGRRGAAAASGGRSRSKGT